MKIGIKVGDVMTRNFVSVSPDITIAQCATEMIKKKVGSLIVKTQRRLEGILTEGDIVKALASKMNTSKAKAREIMSKRVLSVGPSLDIYDALVLMKSKNVRWLPITVKNDVIGMLTIKDILRIEPSLFDIVSEMQPIREEMEKMKAIKLRRKGSEQVWAKEGECEECDAYGILYSVDGRLICERCKESEE